MKPLFDIRSPDQIPDDRTPTITDEQRNGGVTLEDKTALSQDLGVPVMSGNDFANQQDPTRYGGVTLEDKNALSDDLGVPVMSGNDFVKPEDNTQETDTPAAALVKAVGTAKPAPKRQISSAISEPVLRYMADKGDPRAQQVLKDAYGPELNDAALKAALEDKAKKEDSLDYNVIAGEFGKAYADSQGAKGVDATSDYVKKKMLEAGRGVEAIDTRRKGLDQDLKRQDNVLDLGDKQQTSSPDSEISALARDFAKNKLGLNVSDGVSYDALKGVMTDSRLTKQFEDQIAARKEIADLTRQQMDLRQKELSTQKEQVRNDRIDSKALDYTKALTGDSIFKDMQKQGLALDQVSQLLDEAKRGTTVAFAAVGTKLARAMGEVGVLTDQDVKRYVTSGKWNQKFYDLMEKAKTGHPSPQTMIELNKVLGALKDQFVNKVQPIYDTYANRLSRNLHMPLEEAYSRLDAPMPGQAKASDDRNPQSITQSQNSPNAKNDKIMVSNGKEHYLIDPTDLQEALATPGFKRVD